MVKKHTNLAPEGPGWFKERKSQFEDGYFPAPCAHIDWQDTFTRSGSVSEAAKVVGTLVAIFGAGRTPEAAATAGSECRMTLDEIAKGSSLSLTTTQAILTEMLEAGWLAQRPSHVDGAPVLVLWLPTLKAIAPEMLGPQERCAALTIGCALGELARPDGPDKLPAPAVLIGALVAVASAIAADHGPAEAARSLRDLAALIEHGPSAWSELPPTDAGDGFEAEAEAAHGAGIDPAAGPSAD
ncbi:hypothetical protein BDE18_1594 [Paracoccus pantotrophus]|uniref:Uncharacterized protein n=1 Tax=Paracoccus pantotrophus TaxID=82367 RepID=A0AAE6NYF3_PARPN|nr:hypothetical protein [Paracoccus pantotrophus]QFG37293.1 hypothetical protein ESD82_14075 [Paracoccus pantotrophus]RKS52275.1 hypothetical protein BDE18_1594 [Paracoccus pantotrophus]